MKINLYDRFLLFFIKKGKKSSLKFSLNNVFFVLQKKIKISYIFILFKFFSFLMVVMEAKKIKYRKRFIIIPFVISLTRKFYKILNWLMLACYQIKLKISLKKKLIKELKIFFLKTKFSKIYKFYSINYSLVFANRSNLHFRW